MGSASAWIRRLPTWAILSILVALATAIIAMAVALEWPTWARIAGAAVLFLFSTAVVLEKVRTEGRETADKEEQKRLDQERKAAEWEESVGTCFRVWPAPLISDLNPHDLGVKRVGLPDSEEQYFPRYVARDIDQKVQQQLRSRGLALLIGIPGSGVTRTAYEVAASLHTKPVVLIPEPPDGLKRAVDELELLSRQTTSTRMLVWLDRIDKFAYRGLTVALLRRCLKIPGLRIVATIPSTRYEGWVADNSLLSEEFGRPITLDRMSSPAERRQAEEMYPGIDFSEGIAVAFLGLTTLLVRMRAGQTTCSFEQSGDDCALSRAIIDVATAWAATGTPRPITRRQIEKLLRRKLGPNILANPTHLTEAFEWATAPVTGGNALLTASDPDGQSFVASQHIVNLRLSEGGPPTEELWNAALSDADAKGDSDAVGQIGFRAHISGEHKIAGKAWAKVTSLNEPSAISLRRAVEYSRTRGDPLARLRPEQRLLELTRLAHGPDSAESAAILMRLGMAYDALGQLSKAAELYEQALKISETASGLDDPTVAVALNELGNAWRNLGEPTKARELLERALSINETAFGLDDPKVAHTLTFLAGVWVDLGRPDTAQALAERALKINEDAFGPDALVVAQSLNQLGSALMDLGKNSEAIKQLERSLRINEKNFKSRNAQEAVTVALLGVAWRAEGYQEKAREMIERALRINTEFFGPDHPLTAGNMHNLGVTLVNQREYAEARDLLEQALVGIERGYGPTSPKFAAVLDHLGVAWRALGNPSEGRKFNERALRILRQFYGTDHPQVAIALRHLGQSYAALGNTQQARDYYQQALTIMHTRYPRGHPLTKLIAHDLRMVAPDLLVSDDGRVYKRDGASES